MTDIERIAYEARLPHCIDDEYLKRGDWREYAARFAALVAEECAKVCEERFSDGALVIAAAIRAKFCK